MTAWIALLSLTILFVISKDRVRAGTDQPMLAHPFVAASPDPANPPRSIICEAPPTPVVIVSTHSKYQSGDSTRSALDASASASYAQQMKPVLTFRQTVVGFANKYWRDPINSVDAGLCAWSWLEHWARARAMTDLRTDQARMGLGQTLSAAALAYIQVADLPGLGSKQHLFVRRWIEALAIRSMSYMNSDPLRASTRNNLRYWSGLGVAATGIALGRMDLLEWGVDSARLGLSQVTAGGYLPHELARGKRARDYHIFAAAPLTMIAVLGKANGVHLTSGERHALRILLRRVIANLGQGTHFEQKTGVVQVPFPGGLVQRHRIAFLEAFLSLEYNPKARIVLQNKRPVAYSSLGGDLTLLFGRSN